MRTLEVSFDEEELTLKYHGHVEYVDAKYLSQDALDAFDGALKARGLELVLINEEFIAIEERLENPTAKQRRKLAKELTDRSSLDDVLRAAGIKMAKPNWKALAKLPHFIRTLSRGRVRVFYRPNGEVADIRNIGGDISVLYEALLTADEIRLCQAAATRKVQRGARKRS
jgi:hypothetical protein